MNLLKTFFGAFQRSRHRALDVPLGSVEFVGEPKGEVDVLKEILRRGLECDVQLKKAYLVLARHSDEAECRLALCIDSDSAPEDVIKPLSKHCSQFIESIDILFFGDLSQRDIDHLKSIVDPFIGKPDSA